MLADANAIGNSEITAGTTLKVPDVGQHKNDATTFKPYNPADTIGNTSPTLPYIPAPEGPACWKMVVMIVVVIVVTYFTLGSGTEFVAGLLPATMAPATAAAISAVGGAFIAGAAGSIAGQVVGKALGIVDHFSLREAVGAGLANALTAGVAQLQVLGPIAKIMQASKFAKVAISAALNSLTGYIGNKIAGVPDTHFSWKTIAASAVASAVSTAVSGTMKEATGFLSRLGKGLAEAMVSKMSKIAAEVIMTGKSVGDNDAGQFFADVFGTGLGNAMVGTMQERQQGSRAPRTINSQSTNSSTETTPSVADQFGFNWSSPAQETPEGFNYFAKQNDFTEQEIEVLGKTQNLTFAKRSASSTAPLKLSMEFRAALIGALGTQYDDSSMKAVRKMSDRQLIAEITNMRVALGWEQSKPGTQIIDAVEVRGQSSSGLTYQIQNNLRKGVGIGVYAPRLQRAYEARGGVVGAPELKQIVTGWPGGKTREEYYATVGADDRAAAGMVGSYVSNMPKGAVNDVTDTLQTLVRLGVVYSAEGGGVNGIASAYKYVASGDNSFDTENSWKIFDKPADAAGLAGYQAGPYAAMALTGPISGATRGTLAFGETILNGLSAFNKVEDVVTLAGRIDEPFTTFYHGTSAKYASEIRLNGIDLSHSKPTNDFGPGFYMANSRVEALKSAEMMNGGVMRDVVEFRVPNSELAKLDSLTFKNADADWLGFVGFHKNAPGGYRPPSEWMVPFDITRGPMVRQISESGKISHYTNRGYQTSIHTDRAVDLFNRFMIKGSN